MRFDQPSYWDPFKFVGRLWCYHHEIWIKLSFMNNFKIFILFLFPDVQMQLKTYFFIPFVHSCMHLNYGVISGSHAFRDCVWHIILDAELYTTCSGERVLVATRFNVTFLLLRLCYKNTRTCFSKDEENLTTYGYVLWCSQIVCIRPYSLNTIIAFYSVNEWTNFAVSVWLMACHATMLSPFYLESTNLGIGALLRSSFVTSVTC